MRRYDAKVQDLNLQIQRGVAAFGQDRQILVVYFVGLKILILDLGLSQSMGLFERHVYDDPLFLWSIFLQPRVQTNNQDLLMQ